MYINQVLSHWQTNLGNLQFSSQSFYNQVTQTLMTHKPPNATSSVVSLKEKGIFSASRDYLRVKTGNLVYDICAAPYGNDFYISYWFYETAGAMRQIFQNTKFGNFLEDRASRKTFYQADEEGMFSSTVHNAILETIDAIVKEKGIRPLTDIERMAKVGGM